MNSSNYISGANAYLLAEVPNETEKKTILPLSFKEFINYANFEKNISIEEKFKQYMKYGGVPEAVALISNEHLYNNVVKGIYYMVLFKEIIEKYKLIDASLLEKVLKYLMNNTGSLISAKQIADYLTAHETKVTHNTVLTYLKLLEDACLVYKVSRYDMLRKRMLKTLDKYYVVDIGIQNTIVGFNHINYANVIENIVYFELLRRGYNVVIGKVRKDNSYDIDFIATNPVTNEIRYYQIALSITDKKVMKKKLAPLKAVDENSEKTILTMDTLYSEKLEKGIKCQNMIHFLLRP